MDLCKENNKELTLHYSPLSFIYDNGKPYHILRVLRFLKTDNREKEKAKIALKAQRNPDGGWPWHWEPDKPSGIAETARAVEILIKEGEDKKSNLIETALEFIFSHQQSDGGWAENQSLAPYIPEDWDWISTTHSATWITGSVICALVEACCPDNLLLERAVEFLRLTQNEEGGWPTHVSPDYSYGSDLASMDNILRAFFAIGESRESKVISSLEGCVIKLRDKWKMPAFSGSVLAILYHLGYKIESEYVFEVINQLIKSQNFDGGWGWFEGSPSDVWYTTYCAEQLSLFGVKLEDKIKKRKGEVR